MDNTIIEIIEKLKLNKNYIYYLQVTFTKCENKKYERYCDTTTSYPMGRRR